MMKRPLSPLLAAAWLLGLLLLSLRLCEAASSRRVALTGRVEVGWTGGCTGCGEPCAQRLAFRDDLGRLYNLALPEAVHARLGDPIAAMRRRWQLRGSIIAERSGGRSRTSIAVSDLAPAPTGDVRAQNFGLPLALGPRPFVTVLCRFADGVGITPQQPDYFARAMDTTYPRMGHYFGELSFGQMDLSGSQVAGWYTLPHPRSYYLPDGGGINDWNHEALIRDVVAAADPDVDFHSFYGVNIAINVPVPCCWCWIRNVQADGRSGLWPFTMTAATAQGAYYQASWAHEMGHALGMPHSSGSYAETYDSKWDVMSQGFGTGTLTDPAYPVPAVGTISYHKDILGWIPVARKYVAQIGSSASVALERLSQPATANYLMAQIPLSGTSNRYYTVEARNSAGYDRNLPREGVVIHLVDTARSDRQAQVVDADGNGDPNDAGATWETGETFEDRANHVRVTVSSATGSGYVLQIANGGLLNAPAGLAASVLSPTAIRLDWTDHSAEETGFDVERRTGTAGPWTAERAPADATSYADTGLAPNTVYTYRVRASNPGGASDYSNLVSATTHSVYAIQGRVTAGGAGLSGVTVSVGTASATTAPDGSYRVSGLASGTYAVTAQLAGYAFAPPTQSVTLGPDRGGVDFAGTRVYRLSGRVTFNGSGAGGVSVSAGGSAVTSRTDGTYVIGGLPAGTYVVTPSDARYGFAPTSRSVTLSADTTGVDFEAALRTYSASGRVTRDGAGLAGVELSVAGRTVTTDGSGTYRVSGLAPGTYTATPGKAEHVFAPSSRTFTVGPDAGTLDFTAALKTYRISGAVTEGGTGLGGALVRAGGKSAVTAGDGTFALVGLPAGSYSVTASKPEYKFSPEVMTVTLGPDRFGVTFTAERVTYTISGTATAGGLPLAGARVSAGAQSVLTDAEGSYLLLGLTAGAYAVAVSKAEYVFAPATRSVTVGPDQAGIDFTATAKIYSVAGTVTLDGRPLSGAQLAAGGLTAVTSATGTYLLSGLAAGTYAVTAAKAECEFTPAARSVTVGPDQAGADFTATARTYAISGTVTSDGLPLPGTQVSAGGRSGTTDAAGAYVLAGLRAGTYEVVASRAEYVFAPAVRSVTVGPDQSGADFAGSLKTYSISGTVSGGGTPLAGAQVAAGGATAVTDAGGAYRLTGLVAGTYQISASKADYIFVPAVRSVKVGPDQASIDYAAVRTYTISGRVLEGDAGRGGVTVAAGDLQVVTASDGSFALTGLRAGRYEVTPALQEYVLSPVSIPVSLGPDAPGLAFMARRAYRVSGLVAENGFGLAGVTVTAGALQAVTGADGRYVLESLVAGTHVVAAARAGYAFEPASRTLSVGADQAGVDFVARRLPQVSGLTLKFSAVRGGTKCQGTVTLDRPATAVLAVALLSDSAAVIVPPKGVKIAKGKTTAKFTLKTARVQQDVAATVTASCNGSSQFARLGVNSR